jgi:acyl dehydratase
VFGGLVAPGTLIVCARSWLVNHLDRCPAYSAGLGVENMNLLKPVRPGDTLRLEVRVLSARLSQSRPDHGVVVCKNLIYNQNDELVMELDTQDAGAAQSRYCILQTYLISAFWIQQQTTRTSSRI